MRLKFFSISFFAPILGLGGLTIVLQKMEEIYGFSSVSNISNIILLFTIFVIVATFTIYLLKLFYFPQEVKKEFLHPVKINFFPAFPKSLLIISIAFLIISPSISKILWIV